MLYEFKAVNVGGRMERGECTAASMEAALQVLAERRLTPLELTEKVLAPSSKGENSARRMNQTDLVAFIRELATLSESGVSLADALSTLHSANSKSVLRDVLATMLNAIRGGEEFSRALEKSGLRLPEYVLALVRAGEATGNLGFALARCAEQMEFDARMQQQTREAMTYPAVLMGTGVVAVLFVFSFVVPRFAGMLRGHAAHLPWISKAVLGLGVFVSQNLWAVIGGLVAGVVVLVSLVRQPVFRARMLLLAARLPMISEWVTSGETARWTSTLSVLLQSRVPILTAIDLASGALRLGDYSRKLQDVGAEVNRGKRLSAAIEAHNLLEGSALSMLKVGEHTGEIAKMLGHVAQYWIEKNRTLQRRMVSLVEPASILIIGLIVGVVMVGVVMAMASLTEVKL